MTIAKNKTQQEHVIKSSNKKTPADIGSANNKCGDKKIEWILFETICNPNLII